MGAGLAVRDLLLSYPQQAGGRVPVLDLPAFAVASGTRIGLTGASGSGKTSLLHLVAGIERPDQGAILWDGLDIIPLSEAARDRWRRRHVGLVFQDFHLVPGLSALENILLPARFEGLRLPSGLAGRGRDLLERVGVPDRHVEVLSRGQQQRVAVARALLFAPPVLLADEPTASLDAAAGSEIARLLIDLAAETGATLVVVSHDPALLERLERTDRLVEGRVAEGWLQ